MREKYIHTAKILHRQKLHQKKIYMVWKQHKQSLQGDTL